MRQDFKKNYNLLTLKIKWQNIGGDKKYFILFFKRKKKRR